MQSANAQNIFTVLIVKRRVCKSANELCYRRYSKWVFRSQNPTGSRGSVTPWGYMGMEFLDGVNYYGILLAFMMVLATDNDLT